MDNFDFHPHDAGGLLDLDAFASNTQRPSSYPPFTHPPSQLSAWRTLNQQEMVREDNMYYHPQQHASAYTAQSSSEDQQHHQQQPPSLLPPLPQNGEYSRPGSNHSNQAVNLQSSGVDLEYAGLYPNHWQVPLQQAAQHHQQHQLQSESQALQSQQRFDLHNNGHLQLNTFSSTPFVGQLQASPVGFMASTSVGNYPITTGMNNASFVSMAGPMDSMTSMGYVLSDYQTDTIPPGMALNNAALQQHVLNLSHQAGTGSQSSVPGSSPTGSISDGWSIINDPGAGSREPITVFNPSQNLHHRTGSGSSSEEELSSSWEDPSSYLESPHDYYDGHYLDYLAQHQHELPIDPHHSQPLSSGLASPSAPSYPSSGSSGSLSTSPTSSGPTSPPLRRRTSPLDGNSKPTKSGAISKKTAHSSRKDVASGKAARIGRRTGPLKPEQRQSAHEIRKLRACLRCKFLKKTCDKGEPCGGCRPSHARLWQVPCTRMDIKDIAYFMKDWKADYERHVSLGFSVGNIKGFSAIERTLYITHGYGHYLPISAREVFVRDEKCFGVDWVESIHENPLAFQITTAKLSAGMEGVSTSLLSEYLDRHLDQGFENFVDEHFEGTVFLTEILKTAYRYYEREKNAAVRKALKLFIAYNLTLQVTMVEGLSEEEQFSGKIEHEGSRYHGKTVAPVMINFQVKCALADMWRELQKDILHELSKLYSSVYSGDKLKNWPTIFMLAAILLAIWEEMQFDCRYRVPDEAYVDKFCDEMETTPVGVIVGLFQAISTKLPGLQEWDTKKHHHLLGSNPAVCDALTEVKGHVNKYGQLIRPPITYSDIVLTCRIRNVSERSAQCQV